MNANQMMKQVVLFCLFLVLANYSNAQVNSAMIGVNGLTCSACSRTVEMGIRKLNFVKDVKMNLENTEGRIYFKEGVEIDFDKIAKAVINAGFSVRYLKATFVFTNFNLKNGACFISDKYNFQFVNSQESILNGENEIKFIGEIFQPKSEFNKLKQQLKNTCFEASKKVYFVSL